MPTTRKRATVAESFRTWRESLDLFGAVKAGDREAVRRLIDAGSDIKERDDFGRTALFWAICKGHGGSRESIVSLLIEKGGVNLCEARTNDGTTALMAAGIRGHESIARQLLGVVGADRGGVHARNTYGHTALVAAAEQGHESTARLLIENGSDVNAKTTFKGATALLKSSWNGHESVVRLLLEKGADVNVRSVDGSTALMQACERGHESIARLLIEKGSDVNVRRPSDGSSALVRAALSGHVPTLRLLIEKRKEIVKDDDGPDTRKENALALMAAANNGHEEVFHDILTGHHRLAVTCKTISIAVQTLMKKVKEKQNTPVRDHARSVQKVIDEDKEQLPDGLYVKLCGINKRAYDEI
jgi:ankyrin repeat protein